MTWPGVPLLPSAAPADSWPGVLGRGGGLPLDSCPDPGRRHLPHPLGAAPRLVVCPLPQETCLLRGQGCRSPRSAGGQGSHLWGHPWHSLPYPPLVCWGNLCQARCVPELSALNSVSAFLHNLLPSIDVRLQTCFQCEILLHGHPPVPGRAALAPRAPVSCLGAESRAPHTCRDNVGNQKVVGVFVILMDGAQYLLGPICPATGVTTSQNRPGLVSWGTRGCAHFVAG